MKLSYGKDNTCDIARTDVIRIAPRDVATIPDHQIANRVQQTLASPLDYPDLANATVPGDKVAVAIEYGVPHVELIVKGAVESLRHSEVENSSITILLASEFAADSTALHNLQDVLEDELKLIVHSPDEEDELSLLGITAAQRPLRLNRVLCDADLVIPVGVADSPERSNVSGSFFPAFSDLTTRRRFQSPHSHESVASRQKLDGEVEECHWMLGVNLAVQIVPGPRGQIAEIYCGTPAGVQRAAQEAYRQIWAADVKARTDLVVATIVGDHTRQTWQNVSRALAVADNFLEPGGALAICTEISAKLGPSGKRLRDAQDLHEVERRLLKDEFADTVSALGLCRSLQRGTVYLKSRLDPAFVERLGLAPIQSDGELERLTRGYRQCLVLEEAQYLEPKLINSLKEHGANIVAKS